MSFEEVLARSLAREGEDVEPEVPDTELAVKPDPGSLPARDLNSWVDQTLLANKQRNFVQRMVAPERYPSITNDDGSTSTHRMAWAEDDKGAFVYPTIVHDEATNTLRELGGREAMKHAVDTGELIRFGSREEADTFSREYKRVWRKARPTDAMMTDANIGAAAFEDAEARTRALSISQRLNIPANVVEGDFEYWERIDLEDRARAASHDSPAIEKLLAKPETSSIALRDLVNLQEIAGQVTEQPELEVAMLDLPGVATRFGQYDLELATAGWDAAMGTQTPEQAMAYQTLRANRPPELKTQGGSVFDAIVGGSARTTPIIGSAAVASAEVGLIAGTTSAAFVGPETFPAAAAAGAKVGGFLQLMKIGGGLVYDQGLTAAERIRIETGEEIPQETLVGLAVVGGIFEGALESLSLKRTAKLFPGGARVIAAMEGKAIDAILRSPTARAALARFAGRWTESVATEGITEAAQQVVPAMSEGIVRDMMMPGEQPWVPEDFVEQLAEAGVQGGAAAIGLGVVGGTLSVTVDQGQKILQRAHDLRRLDIQVETVESSSLAKAAPGVFREYLQDVLESKGADVPILVSPDVLEAVVPRSLLEEKMPDVLAQIPEARALRGEVVIPRADYLTYLGKGYHEQLKGGVRIGLSALTEAEAQQAESDYSARLQAQLEQDQIVGEDGRSALEVSSDRVYDATFEGMLQMGRSVEEATHGSKLMQKAITTLSSQIGRDPWEFFSAMALEFQGPAKQAIPLKPMLAELIDRAKLEEAMKTMRGEGPKLPFHKYPVLERIKKAGGVEPTSPLAGELEALGVERSGAGSVPGVYRVGGMMSLDELDTSDAAELIGRFGPESFDAYGRLDPNALYEAIDAELRNSPYRSEDQLQAIEALEAPARELRQFLEEVGADIENITPEQVLELFQRQGLMRNATDVEEQPTYTVETSAERSGQNETDSVLDTTLEQSRDYTKEVLGLQGIIGFMLPEERERLKVNTAQRVVETFDRLPDVEEAASIAWEARIARGWYERSARALRAMFGKNTEQFVAVLASLSPMKEVKKNLEHAVLFWAAWRRAGSPLVADPNEDTRRWNAIRKANKKHAKGEGPSAEELQLPKPSAEFTQIAELAYTHARGVATGSAVPALARILSKSVPREQWLEGLKVSSFNANLLGAVHRVTLDTHLNAYVGLGLAFDKTIDYVAVSALVRKAAAVLKERTGQDWTPAEVQEAIWSWVYVAKNERKRTGKSVMELARENGITEAAIAAAPDFDSLLYSAKYQQLLKEIGLGKELNALRRAEGSRGRRRGVRRRTIERPDPGIARDAHARFIALASARVEQFLREGGEELAAAEEVEFGTDERVELRQDPIELERETKPRKRATVRVFRPKGREQALPEIVFENAPRVGLVEVGTLSSGIMRVETAEDVAHVLMPLAETYPQETLIAVVTDADGNILQIVQSSLGTMNETSLHPMLLAGPGFDAGAAHLWWVHNHPSAVGEPSVADVDANARITSALTETGITNHAVVISAGVGGSDFTDASTEFSADGKTRIAVGYRPFKVEARARDRELKIMQRRFVKPPGKNLDQPAVTTARDALRAIEVLHHVDSGLLLLDGRNRPVGFLPLSKDEMLFLRTSSGDTGVGRILASAHRANAVSMIAMLPRLDALAARNLKSFGNIVGLGLLDMIDYQGNGFGGTLPPAFSTFYQDELRKIAYHGTGPAFDRFLNAFIGSGEGTANQGYGHYLTSADSAMRFYAQQEGQKRQRDARVLYTGHTPLSAEAAAFLDGLTEELQIRLADEQAFGGMLDIDNQRERVAAMISVADESVPEGVAEELQNAHADGDVVVKIEGERGVGLEVAIPAEDQLLDWRKPMSEQTETVRAMVAPLLAEVEDRLSVALRRDTKKWFDDSRAEEFYWELARQISEQNEDMFESEAQKAASLKLLSLGIKGHIYESGHGNENYVIYDEESVQIVRRLFQDSPDLSERLSVLQEALAAAHQAGDEQGVRAARRALRRFADEILDQRGARGSLRFNPEFTDVLMKMGQGGDASTFLHEGGHLFLELMLRTAEDPAASPRLQNDRRAVLDWFAQQDPERILAELVRQAERAEAEAAENPGDRGLRVAAERAREAEQLARSSGPDFVREVGRTFGQSAPAELRGYLITPFHETWARGFEAYLREGVAPSLELRDAFARFYTWLTRIYPSLRMLKVELTAPVREVMDRLLASDTAIQEARIAQSFLPAFKDAVSAGMTEAEFAEYQAAAQRVFEDARRRLAGELLDELDREQRADVKAAAAEITEQVTADMNARPIFRVKSWLQTGKLPDGTDIEGVPHRKLSRDGLVRVSGKHILKVMRPGKFSFWQAKGGIEPEAVADIFGFKSAAHLIQMLVETGTRQEAIAAEAKSRLQAKFGDILRDGRLPERAIAASMTNAQGDFLVAELRSLARRISQESTPASIAKRVAERAIGSRKYRDLRPDHYRAQESRAAARAAEAIRARDWQTAHDEKRAELVAHYMAIEAVKRKERAEKIRDYLTRMGEPKAQARLGKAGQLLDRDYQGQVNALLFRFKFQTISNVASRKREALADWIIAREAEGGVFQIDPRIRDETFTIDWKSLTPDELEALEAAVRSIDHNARIAGRMLADKKKREHKEMVDELSVSIAASVPRKVKVLDVRGDTLDAMRAGARNLHGWLTKLEEMFIRLDGGERGLMWETCFVPFAEAETQEHAMLADVERELHRIFKGLNASGRMGKEIHVRGVGSFSRERMLMIALNQGNEYNKTALVEGGYLGQAWGQNDVDAVLKHMTEADWKAVSEIAALIGTLRKPAFDLQEELTGVRPQAVEGDPIQTPFGKLDGWYFPLKADPEYSRTGFELQEAEAAKDLFTVNAFSPMTRHGHLQARTNFAGRAVLLSSSVISEHLYNAIHDITHRKALIQVDRLTRDPKLSGAIAGAVGEQMYRQIRPWLKGIAGERLAPSIWPFDKAFGKARMGATVGYMGFKATVILSQLTGFSNSANELGALRMAQEMTTYFAHGTGATVDRVTWALSLSAELRRRMTNFDRDARDAVKRATGALSTSDHLQAQAIELSMRATAYMDMAVAVPTWTAAYGRELEQSADVERAILVADSVVRLTQGSGAPKDLARISTGPEIVRLFTMFGSFFNALYNQGARTITGIRDGRVGVRDAAAACFYLWFVPSLVGELLAGRGPDDDEDWWAWAARELVGFPFAAVPLARDLYSMAENRVRGRPVDFNLPATQVFETSVEALVGTTMDLIYKGEIGRRRANQILETVGYWGPVRLPSKQMEITGWALYDLWTEQGDVEARDLFFARPPKRRAQ